MVMGDTAEVVAKRYKITREQQDQYSLLSQQRTARAQDEGFFKEEIAPMNVTRARSEDHTSELQSQSNLVCRLLLEKKNKKNMQRAAAITSTYRRNRPSHHAPDLSAAVPWISLLYERGQRSVSGQLILSKVTTPLVD